MSMSKIIKQKRLEKKLTQEELGNLLGLKKSAINKYENGSVENIKRSTIEKMAEIFGIKPSVLMGWESPVENTSPTNIVPLIHKDDGEDPRELITVYGEVCAGDGMLALEDPFDKIYNPYPKFSGEAFALLVKGDSMNNVVSEDMYAIIRKQPTVDNGEIAVVLIDGDIGMLKRFYRLDHSTVVLKPDSSNPIHRTLVFENEDIERLYIVGKYIGSVSPMY